MTQQEKINLALNVANLAIKAGATFGSIWVSKYMADKMYSLMRRIEFEPTSNGRLLAVEYFNERPVKTRYATKQEIWSYSFDQMELHLGHLGLV